MEIKQSNIYKIAYSCFYLGVVIEVLIVLIDKSAYLNPIEGQLFRVTFLMFLIKTCMTKYSWKEYLVIGLFLGLGAISYLITGRNDIIRIVMFLAACKNIDMIKCLKLVFWMTLSGCMIIIILSLTGIFGTASLTQDYGRGSVETRYVLGMGHPNSLQCMICVLTGLGLYLYYSKLRWYQYIMVLLLNIFFFMLSDSKTALLVAAYMILAFFLAGVIRKKRICRLFALGNIFLYIVSIIVSVLAAKDAMCLYDYFTKGIYSKKAGFYLILDKLLTGRIRSLFGTTRYEGTIQTWSLFSGPENSYYFDMGWVRLFYWYGIIPAGIAVGVLAVILFWLYKRDKTAEIVLITAFAMYTVVEAHVVSVYIARNYVLFIIGMYWHCIKLKRE